MAPPESMRKVLREESSPFCAQGQGKMFEPLAAAPSWRRRSLPMVRWIAFDDDTAEAVVSRLRRGAAEIQHNSPVEAALRTDGPSVIVLPSPNPGRLLIAHFIPSHKAEAPAKPADQQNV